MDSNLKNITTIDEYIASFPEDVQEILQGLRRTIREAAPDAVERIAYQMPTFWQNGNLVHFAAFKNHIGFYPNPSGVEVFQEALASYKTSKGAIQFPIDQPLPLELISEIVRFRVTENLEKSGKPKPRPQ